MRIQPREASDDAGAAPQHISNVLLSSAKLRKQPCADDLQLLVQLFLQQDVLAAAAPQAIANITWALSQLYELPSWQGGISEQQLQQLLGKEQLQLLVVYGKAQEIYQCAAGTRPLCYRFRPCAQRQLRTDNSQAAAGKCSATGLRQLGSSEHCKQHVGMCCAGAA